MFEVALGHTHAASFAGEAGVKALVGELKHDTSFKRRAAAEALEDVADPQATLPLLAALKDQDPTVRVSAIHALSKDNSGRVTLKLLERLRDPESCVRLAAADVLARRIDPALAPDFLGLLNDSSFEVRLSAVQFLGRIRDPEIASALLPLLADSDSDVRQATAQALGTIGEPASIEALVLTLTDEERAVRQAAEAALGRIDPNWVYSEPAQRAVPHLEAVLNDQRGWSGPPPRRSSPNCTPRPQTCWQSDPSSLKRPLSLPAAATARARCLNSCRCHEAAANCYRMSIARMPRWSLRPEQAEFSRLAWAFALSLAFHLLLFSGYHTGQKYHLWQHLHWPAWLQPPKFLTELIVPKNQPLRRPNGRKSR